MTTAPRNEGPKVRDLRVYLIIIGIMFPLVARAEMYFCEENGSKKLQDYPCGASQPIKRQLPRSPKTFAVQLPPINDVPAGISLGELRAHCEAEVEELINVPVGSLQLGDATTHRKRLELTKAKCKATSLACYHEFHELARVRYGNLDLSRDVPVFKNKVNWAYEKCGIAKPEIRQRNNAVCSTVYFGNQASTVCH
jgi:hypothetical protein